jgi:hypothetical protein
MFSENQPSLTVGSSMGLVIRIRAEKIKSKNSKFKSIH